MRAHAVYHQHNIKPIFKQPKRQRKIALDVARVADVYHFAFIVCAQIVYRNLLFIAERAHRIYARKIDEFKLLIVAQKRPALFLNRHTVPVAHMLICTSEQVEESCFSGVWISNEQNLFQNFFLANLFHSKITPFAMSDLRESS